MMSEARRLSDLIDEFVRKESVSDKLRSYHVVGDWEKIVGEPISRNTEIIKIENGTLYVRVKTASWRNELIFMKQVILKKIAQNYPNSGVENIFFV
jgi:predicted nucleic acid-binding Zn ribbon protein